MVQSIKELREICYKDSKGKRPLYMEKVTMKVSVYVTKLLLYTPIGADQITMGMVLLVILGSIFMAFGTLKYLMIGILIIHFTVILDNVNGEVARYRKQGSMTGTFLEQYYHELSVPLIFFSLGFGVFLQTGSASALVFGFLCAIFSRSTVLSALKSAVVKNAIRDRSNKKVDEKLKKYHSITGKYPNVEGGSTKTGAKFYRTYDLIREFWSAPFNIVHINVLVLLEILNRYHFHLIPAYNLLYWYLAVYGSVSVLIQLISFIVHYGGNTIYHYYVAMLGKEKK